jgi:hypothetical protein
MHDAMDHKSVKSSCQQSSRCEAVLDSLRADLAQVAQATGSDHVPIAARADYLRARDAYRRAVIAWAGASGEQELDTVRELVERCRSALEASRARLRR